MKRHALLLLLAILGATSGCEAPAAEATGGKQPATNETTGCSGDADCPGDLVCLAAAHACSAAGALPYRVSLNVVPPTGDPADTGAPWVQTQWVDLAPGAEHERNLTLSTPLVLEGPISLPFGDNCYVPTSIVATTTADITGWVEYRFTGTITPASEPNSWRYRVGVLPDRQYRLTVFIGHPACPSAEDGYPPVVAERFVSNASDRAEIAFVAPPLAEPLVGTLGFDDGTPVVGVRLVASSPDGTTTFGASVTDAYGRFELRLPSGMERFRLVAKATSDFPQFPEQPVEGQFLAGDAAQGDFALTVPALPAPTTVTVRARDSAGDPEPLVRVTLTGTVAGGTITTTATTDDAGLALLTVYAGGYTVIAEPPEGSHAGALAATVPVATGGTDLPLALPEKVSTRIDVLDEPTGQGVGGADLLLSLASLPGATPALDRSYHLVSDEDGAATARLEPGTWRLLVVPDPSTGLPRWALSDVEIARDTLALPVTIPAPWVLHGRVVDPAGRPVPNAVLEALSAAEAGKDAESATGAGQGYNDRGLTAVIGEAITDAEGRFSLALPFSR